MNNWQKLLDMAHRTPPERDRYVDFLRLLAILFVVVGHWLALVVVVDAEDLRFDHLASIAPRSVWLSWLFQVMSVFFFVGGYANSASWSSAARHRSSYAAWIGARLARLLIPVVPLLLFWVALGIVAFASGVEPESTIHASRAALIPLWFLAVYIMVTLLTPLSLRLFRSIGLFSFWVLFAAAVLVDLAALAMSDLWIRWLNYGFIWLAVHQLGYAWRDGRLDSPSSRVALVLAGTAGLATFIGLLSYPVAMVSVPGEPVSNSRPPSAVLLALGMIQIGILVTLAAPVRRWLQRETRWAAVIAGNRVIMTVFLWHMTTLFACIAASWAMLDGFGLTLNPGSEAWWWARLPWFAANGVVLAGVVAIMARFEGMSKASGREGSPLVKVSGAILACLGLVFIALGGLVSDAGIGVRLGPAATFFAGLLLAVNTELRWWRRPPG
jgi:fucose 4-O-acetylase-like acetyltransferase